MILANIVGIIKLASRHHVTVYTSNLDAIAQGVALAFGSEGNDKECGRYAGEKALQILVDGKHPSDVPITTSPFNPRLFINKRVLKSQGIEIDPRLLFLLEHGKIIA